MMWATFSAYQFPGLEFFMGSKLLTNIVPHYNST